MGSSAAVRLANSGRGCDYPICCVARIRGVGDWVAPPTLADRLPVPLQGPSLVQIPGATTPSCSCAHDRQRAPGAIASKPLALVAYPWASTCRTALLSRPPGPDG